MLSQLQLSREAKSAKRKDEIFSTNRNRHFDRQDDASEILFVGQGIYDRRLTTVRFDRSLKANAKSRTVSSRKRGGSFKALDVRDASTGVTQAPWSRTAIAHCILLELLLVYLLLLQRTNR